MRSVVVVTIQHGVVNQLNLFFHLGVLTEGLLGLLLLAQWRRIRSLYFTHKTVHQLLAETVAGGSSYLLYVRLLGQMI